MQRYVEDAEGYLWQHGRRIATLLAADEQPTAIARWIPILVSSLIFALMHFSHGPDPIPLFFLSLALGFIYQRTHRIVPCIVVHMMLNGFSMVLLAVQIFGNDAAP